MSVVWVLALIVICTMLLGGAKMGLLAIPVLAIAYIASMDKRGIDDFFAAYFGLIVVGAILGGISWLFS